MPPCRGRWRSGPENAGPAGAGRGVTSGAVLPADGGKAASTPVVSSLEGERRAGLVIDFVDFDPLVQLRRELASSLAEQVEAVPLAGVLIRRLSWQPEFAGIGINTAVDVPAEGAAPRGADLIAVRPHRYRGSPDGFVLYPRELLRLTGDARARRSATWKSLVKLNSLSAFLSAAMLRYTSTASRTFGSMTVSLVKGSRLMIPPLPDTEWERGIVAIRNLGTASKSGGTVTPVAIKADPAKIGAYGAAIRRAITGYVR